MSIFWPNFAFSHQDSYKSGRTPFRTPFHDTIISKNKHTYLSLGSNGLSIEVLHTFLAWNSYPHMKISWFQLIMADFDDRWLQKIAIFWNLFQFQARCCKIRTRWAMRIIFYSCDTPRVIFLPWDHLKKGGRKGVRSLSFGWLSSIKNWWKTHTVTTCLNWKQISAPLSAPFSETYPIWKDTSIEFLWHETHILSTLTGLWPSKWSCTAHWEKMKKWKLKKLKLQKIAMWFYFKQSAVKYEPDGLWG